MIYEIMAIAIHYFINTNFMFPEPFNEKISYALKYTQTHTRGSYTNDISFLKNSKFVITRIGYVTCINTQV